MWRYRGQERPPWAETPAAGQESVWDYPRPPRLERWPRRIEVRANGQLLAATTNAWRVCETASPPTVYLPPGDLDHAALVAVSGSSYCEWKGAASYFALAGDAATPVAWTYPAPSAAFTAIAGHFASYPARVACEVDGERVRPQPGGFYGGWITDELVGPFKGEPGTGHW